mgnify:CR=1 FL=1
MKFTMYNPVKINFGSGKISSLGKIVQEYGNKVFIATMKEIVDLGLLEKGIKIIGSFDNEAEHFVRGLPIVADERLPLPDLITHTLPLERLQESLEAIKNGTQLDGKQIVKIVIDPSLS